MNYGKRKLPTSDFPPRNFEANVGSTTEPMRDDIVKRKFRNLNEKKRRDQFNMLINELAAMVHSDGKRRDKTGVLESTMNYLRDHKESESSLPEDVSYSWRPSFLSNDEFTYLILETLNCVILALDSAGTITYISENAGGKLGLSQDLVTQRRQLQEFLKDDSMVQRLITPQEDSTKLFSAETLITSDPGNEEGCKFQPVTLFCLPEGQPDCSGGSSAAPLHNCVVQARTPALTGEYAASADAEFKGIYSLEWKILNLEDKAAAVLGYQPHELLGTSGYNYYHPEDIDNVAIAHRKLLKSGCCTTAPYRMSTRGHGWVWLQSKMFICYDQWAVKPVHIECTHTVPSKGDIEIHKSNKGPLEYAPPAPRAKRPRILDPLTSPDMKKQSDVYSTNLATGPIDRQREQRFGKQLPKMTKTLPSGLLQTSVPRLVQPTHLNPVQHKLHLQLQSKCNTLRSNLERQQAELAQLVKQLNLAASDPSQSPTGYFSAEDVSGLGAAAMTVDDSTHRDSASNQSDFNSSWLL